MLVLGTEIGGGVINCNRASLSWVIWTKIIKSIRWIVEMVLSWSFYLIKCYYLYKCDITSGFFIFNSYTD